MAQSPFTSAQPDSSAYLNAYLPDPEKQRQMAINQFLTTLGAGLFAGRAQGMSTGGALGSAAFQGLQAFNAVPGQVNEAAMNKLKLEDELRKQQQGRMDLSQQIEGQSGLDAAQSQENNGVPNATLDWATKNSANPIAAKFLAGRTSLTELQSKQKAQKDQADFAAGIAQSQQQGGPAATIEFAQQFASRNPEIAKKYLDLVAVKMQNTGNALTPTNQYTGQPTGDPPLPMQMSPGERASNDISQQRLLLDTQSQQWNKYKDLNGGQIEKGPNGDVYKVNAIKGTAQPIMEAPPQGQDTTQAVTPSISAQYLPKDFAATLPAAKNVTVQSAPQSKPGTPERAAEDAVAAAGNAPVAYRKNPDGTLTAVDPSTLPGAQPQWQPKPFVMSQAVPTDVRKKATSVDSYLQAVEQYKQKINDLGPKVYDTPASERYQLVSGALNEVMNQGRKLFGTGANWSQNEERMMRALIPEAYGGGRLQYNDNIISVLNQTANDARRDRANAFDNANMNIEGKKLVSPDQAKDGASIVGHAQMAVQNGSMTPEMARETLQAAGIKSNGVDFNISVKRMNMLKSQGKLNASIDSKLPKSFAEKQ